MAKLVLDFSIINSVFPQLDISVCKLSFKMHLSWLHEMSDMQFFLCKRNRQMQWTLLTLQRKCYKAKKRCCIDMCRHIHKYAYAHSKYSQIQGRCISEVILKSYQNINFLLDKVVHFPCSEFRWTYFQVLLILPEHPPVLIHLPGY